MNNLSAISKEDIIEGVLAEFAKLAEIPRPSGHEKAVSDYLYGLFESMGCKVRQDGVYNIIADMAATEDCQDRPLVVMQAHMDMVCVAEDGVDYDPVKDAIKLVREADKLYADGTSLGADDGMGIAIMVYIMKNLQSHGPLRAIITVDEECGMTGSQNLTDEDFANVKYLINCDSEDWDLLTVGSAGSGDIEFSRDYEPERTDKGQLYSLKLSGLRGGHSGEEINCGAANALKSMAVCLDGIRRKARGFQLVSFDGGRAKNVIPSAAEAVFCADVQKDELQKLADSEYARFMAHHGDIETGASLVLNELEADSAEAMKKEAGDSLIDLLLILPHGVSAMSQLCPGLVESSANIGVVRTDAEAHKVSVQYMPRSSREESIREYYAAAEALGRAAGFAVELGTMFPSWAERKHSKLAEIMLEVFQEQNQQPMRMATIHAGLECSWHLKHNPDMDVVSIGTNNNDIHSPKETLELWTVPPQVLLIAETLCCI